MAALVVEHHPHLVAPPLRECGALEVERPHPQAEPVGEDDGQRRGDRTDFADHQGYAVGSGHHTAAVGFQKCEILTGVGILDELLVPERPGGRHPGCGADGAEPGDTGQQPGLLADPDARVVGLAGQSFGGLLGAAGKPFVNTFGALGLRRLLRSHRPPASASR